MYQEVLGSVATIAGIATLPNTGSNSVLTALSLVSITAGVAMMTTTALRFVAKKRYKA